MYWGGQVVRGLLFIFIFKILSIVFLNISNHWAKVVSNWHNFGAGTVIQLFLPITEIHQLRPQDLRSALSLVNTFTFI